MCAIVKSKLYELNEKGFGFRTGLYEYRDKETTMKIQPNVIVQ